MWNSYCTENEGPSVSTHNWQTRKPFKKLKQTWRGRSTPMPAKGSQDTSLGHHQERPCLLFHPMPLWAPPFRITSLQVVTPERPLRVTFHYYSLARTVTEREEGGFQQAGVYTIWVWFQTRMTKVLADILSPPQWFVYNRGSWTKNKILNSLAWSQHACQESRIFFIIPANSGEAL